MIRHICMFTLKAENKERNILQFFEGAEKVRELDEIKKFNVVKNVQRTPASNYDVALIFDFDTVEALDKYLKSPQHREYVEFVKPILVHRVCIDYEF